MHTFRKDLATTSIDQELYDTIKDACAGLPEEFVNVEYGCGKYGEFISVKIESDKCIYINLCLISNVVDLEIGKTKSYRYMMDELISQKEKKEFSKFLYEIMHCEIEERLYENGNIEFVNLETDEVLLSTKKIFSFFFQERIKEKYIYSRWMS